MDGLVYYTDFEKCDKVLWEKFFRCEDLGKDLPPVIQQFKEFEASEAAKQPQEWPESKRLVPQDRETAVPDPFSLEDFLLTNQDKLADGELIPLFPADHPDKEFQICVAGGPSEQSQPSSNCETWLYQIRGIAHVAVQGGTLPLTEGCCCTVSAGTSYDVSRSAGSVGLVVQANPTGNKATRPKTPQT